MSKFGAAMRWLDWYWPVFVFVVVLGTFLFATGKSLQQAGRNRQDRLERFKAGPAEDIAWVSACVQHGTGDLDGCILRLNSLKFDGVVK